MEMEYQAGGSPVKFLEHDPWKGTNSPNLKDSFRRTKYRNTDPLSRRPLARASLFFSPDAVSPGGLLSGLPGVAKRGSISGSLNGRQSSPTRRSFRGNGDMSFPSQERPRGKLSFSQISQRQNGSTPNTNTPLPQEPLLRPETELEAAALPSLRATAAAVSLSTPPLASVAVRLTPTPLAASGIRSTSAGTLHDEQGIAAPTFAFPSLTAEPLLKLRAVTPVVIGRSSIARLLSANQAFVGFRQTVERDPTLRSSSSAL